METNKLSYIENNQSELRAAEYTHLRDSMHDEIDPNEIGHGVILPSTFIGGPRHMHEYYQVALAYVRLHGLPDLSITFTCNPNWPGITKYLKPGQPSYHRYDIVALVCKQKLIKFVHVITKHKLFGPYKP